MSTRAGGPATTGLLADELLDALRRDPGAPALLTTGRRGAGVRVTRGDLAARADACAAALHA
ncbi:hypothetical protein, partial [Thalassiella azotivora]